MRQPVLGRCVHLTARRACRVPCRSELCAECADHLKAGVNPSEPLAARESVALVLSQALSTLLNCTAAFAGHALSCHEPRCMQHMDDLCSALRSLNDAVMASAGHVGWTAAFAVHAAPLVAALQGLCTKLTAAMDATAAAPAGQMQRRLVALLCMLAACCKVRAPCVVCT